MLNAITAVVIILVMFGSHHVITEWKKAIRKARRNVRRSLGLSKRGGRRQPRRHPNYNSRPTARRSHR